MMVFRVSVIIPVYNVEQYIEECLQSVADQTYAKNIECIIVDDKGPDNSMRVVEDFVKNYSGDIDFKIVCREQNGGLSAARNTGIDAASGEYLYFLDSDDTIIPECIEKLINLADKYGGVDLLPALYISDSAYMKQFGRHSFPEFSDDKKLIKRSLLDYDKIPVTAANRLVRREFLIKNNLYFKEGIIHEDNYWTFFIAKYVEKMGFCSEKVYYYRETSGSITKNINVKKEVYAFKTLITDFCSNIDDFESGAQKRLIFLNLLTMRSQRYYESEEQRKQLESLFMRKNSHLEQVLLWVCFNLNRWKFLNSKVINLIQRLYLSH